MTIDQMVIDGAQWLGLLGLGLVLRTMHMRYMRMFKMQSDLNGSMLEAMKMLPPFVPTRRRVDDNDKWH